MLDQIAAKAEHISITAAYPRLLMQLVTERGHDAERLLQGIGLSMTQLESEAARVSAVQYAAIALAAMNECADEGLGYALAMRTPPTAYGPLGIAMMSSDTLGEALVLALKYLPLLQAGTPFDISQDGLFSCVRPYLPVQMLPLPLRRYFAEAQMGGIVRSATRLMGIAHVKECELWFEHPEPPYFSQYASELPTTQHDAPYTQLRFPLALLQHKLPLADRVACAQALAQCDQEITLLTAGKDNLAARVRELLHVRSGHCPAAEDIATQLNMSVRTFKRRLSEQGTSFRLLLEEAQRLSAIELLRQRHLTLERIAQELGYSDPANFTRAFKRWTGMTPSAFRSGEFG